MLSQTDIEQINSHGLSFEEVIRQINLLQHGINYIHLVRPATLNDGIIEPKKADLIHWSGLFSLKQSE